MRAAQLHLVFSIVDQAWSLRGSCFLLLKASVPHMHMMSTMRLLKQSSEQSTCCTWNCPLPHGQLVVKFLHAPFYMPLQAHGGSNALELEAKSQLLIVVAEATVLGSTESASVPFYTGLFQRAVSGSVVLRPGAKVCLCPHPV